jgi:hypothetical protein
MTVKNYIHEDLKSMLNLWHAFCCAVQNIFISSVISKDINIKTVKLYFCLLFCFGLKLDLSLRTEEHRLRVSEKRLLRRICGPKKEVGENCLIRRIIICALQKNY